MAIEWDNRQNRRVEKVWLRASIHSLRGERFDCVLGTFTCSEAVDFVWFFAVSRVQLFHFLDVRSFVERTAQTRLQQRKVRSGVTFAPASRVTRPLLRTDTQQYMHRQTDTNIQTCDLWTTKFCCFGSYCLEHFAIDPACIDHYARTVSEWTKDNTVSFGLRDMIRRSRDCLGR